MALAPYIGAPYSVANSSITYATPVTPSSMTTNRGRASLFPLQKTFNPATGTVMSSIPSLGLGPVDERNIISSIPTARQSYQLLVNEYKDIVSATTKDGLLVSLNKIFTEHFNVINTSGDAEAVAVAVAYETIFGLKKLLDVQFAKDVNCKYMFIGSTPANYGCDLRELIYNRDGTVTNEGTKLLELFDNIATKYLEHHDRIIHAITDIDDTCYANPMHGVAIAGIDRSWLPHQPYPGIKELHRQLTSLPNSSGYTTIVSAAPGAVKSRKLNDEGLIAIFGNNNFAFVQGEESKIGIAAKGISILNTVLKRGDNPGGAFYRGVGDIKLDRIIQYLKIFPERNFIWFGDNGQADEWVGSELLRLYPKRYTVCIHKVKKVEIPIQNIIYFSSYSELAEKLRKAGIFTGAHVKEVIKSARSDCIQSNVNAATPEQRKSHCPQSGRRWYGGYSRVTRKIHKSRKTRKSPIRNNKKYTIRRRRRCSRQ